MVLGNEVDGLISAHLSTSDDIGPALASSSREDAPRDMGFLYSRNRLNVAVSRARALAIVVASPRLLEAGCRTPDQMHAVSALCAFVEHAAGD